MCQIWLRGHTFLSLWVTIDFDDISLQKYGQFTIQSLSFSSVSSHLFICSLEVSSAASSVSAASSASVSDQHQHILQHKQQHQNNLKHLPLCSFAYHQQYHQYQHLHLYLYQQHSSIRISIFSPFHLQYHQHLHLHFYNRISQMHQCTYNLKYTVLVRNHALGA